MLALYSVKKKINVSFFCLLRKINDKIHNFLWIKGQISQSNLFKMPFGNVRM